MLFYVGQPVICVNDNFSWCRKYYPEVIHYPEKGHRYIVRDYVCEGTTPAIVLNEMKNPPVVYTDNMIREAGFWDRRFVAAPLPEEITCWLRETEDAA